MLSTNLVGRHLAFFELEARVAEATALSRRRVGIEAEVLIEESKDADLVVIGFKLDLLKHKGNEVFLGYDSLGNVLFVHDSGEKIIS